MLSLQGRLNSVSSEDLTPFRRGLLARRPSPMANTVNSILPINITGNIHDSVKTVAPVESVSMFIFGCTRATVHHNINKRHSVTQYSLSLTVSVTVSDINGIGPNYKHGDISLLKITCGVLQYPHEPSVYKPTMGTSTQSE